MNGEPRLQTQTAYLGDAMRCYRNFDLPGIDMLCDEKEYNTAKQASSVARQNGVRGLMSELYGVTNWTFDFKGHKGQGDWQAALGVTFRVPRECDGATPHPLYTLCLLHLGGASCMYSNEGM
jgi:hypothetical protein